MLSAKTSNLLIRYLFLSLALLALACLYLCLGEVNLSPLEVWSNLWQSNFDQAAPSPTAEILGSIRLPRLLVALTVGACLAVSGFILQTLSNNDLADPYLTGVSSGAALAVAVTMLAGLSFALIPAFALAGGLGASLAVGLLARTAQGISVSKLLLSGVALSAVCGGLITLVLSSAAHDSRAQGVFFWLAGGISGRGWPELLPTLIYAAIGLIIAFAMSKPLRLLCLGSGQAQALGLNVPFSQSVLLAASVLMCGAAVSLSGIVGFVGLIAPYFARNYFAKDEKLQMIASALIGSILVAASDLAARTLISGQELPLGTLLSLIGGPFFIFLVLKQERT